MKANIITEAEAKLEWDNLQKEGNYSMSRDWAWGEVLEHGWFGFRSGEPQPIIAYSYRKLRKHWRYCPGFSS